MRKIGKTGRAMAEEPQMHGGQEYNFFVRSRGLINEREIFGDIMQPTYPNRSHEYLVRQHFNALTHDKVTQR